MDIIARNPVLITTPTTDATTQNLKKTKNGISDAVAIIYYSIKTQPLLFISLPLSYHILRISYWKCGRPNIRTCSHSC
jgi:hypothetical protein